MQSVENPASVQAEKIYGLFNTFNITAVGMFLLVSILTIYICIKFRAKKGDTAEPEQTSGNSKLEVLMIGVPALLLGYFLYRGVTMEAALLPVVEPGRQPDVIITGHQWWWQVEYPASKVVAANEVHLPVGKHLLLELRSADVIHDWWVPSLGNKMDMIPGQNNFLWVDINKPGNYTGSCSEFCGAQHAWMRITVIAQKEKEYNTWLSKNAKNAELPDDKLAIQGAGLFQRVTCANCHRIQGTSAIATAGPDLTHVAGRQELLTGIMKMNEDDLSRWIDHPQQIKPGALMPDFYYSEDSIKAIAHYLAQLK
jgi:cytochrome c oxidase subunit 2